MHGHTEGHFKEDSRWRDARQALVQEVRLAGSRWDVQSRWDLYCVSKKTCRHCKHSWKMLLQVPLIFDDLTLPDFCSDLFFHANVSINIGVV